MDEASGLPRIFVACEEPDWLGVPCIEPLQTSQVRHAAALERRMSDVGDAVEVKAAVAQENVKALGEPDTAEWHRRGVYLDAMLLMMSIRDVSAVGQWLQDPVILAHEHADAAAGEKIYACRNWFLTGQIYEREHGHSSLLDRKHPFWTDHLVPALARVEKYLAERKVIASATS